MTGSRETRCPPATSATPDQLPIGERARGHTPPDHPHLSAPTGKSVVPASLSPGATASRDGSSAAMCRSSSHRRPRACRICPVCRVGYPARAVGGEWLRRICPSQVGLFAHMRPTLPASLRRSRRHLHGEETRTSTRGGHGRVHNKQPKSAHEAARALSMLT